MSMMYALTAKQRDKQSQAKHSEAENKKTERAAAFEKMSEELKAAQQKKEDSSWLDSITGVLDIVTDHALDFLLSGGNPIVMAVSLARGVGELTGSDELKFVGGMLRPETILKGAASITEATLGEKAGASFRETLCDEQFCGALETLSPYSSSKQRFEGAAKAVKEPEIAEAYGTFKQTTLAVAVTVSTCGSGAVIAAVLIASAALMIEQKAHLLEKMGVDSKVAMGIRIGAQVAVAIGSGAGAADAAMTAAKVGTEAAKTAAKVAASVKSAVHVLKGAEEAAQGGVQIGQAIYKEASDQHLANAEEARNMQKIADRQQQHIIDGLRDLAQSYQRSLSAIAGAIEERDNTSVRLTQRMA
jgi:hypothetical protein